MEVKDNGYYSSNGTIWNTRCNDNSVRIFYMEAKPIHSKDSNDRIGPRFQEVGRYYYQADRPTKENANGSKKDERDI